MSTRNKECAVRQMTFDSCAVAYDHLTVEEVPVENAYSVFRLDVKTPGGFGIVAFRDKVEAERVAAEHGNGKVLRWFELVDERLK